jgi:putative acetyltransferase
VAVEDDQRIEGRMWAEANDDVTPVLVPDVKRIVIDGGSTGCVALRRVSDESSEIKRMFVYPEYHRMGIGRALAEAVIERARALGYRVMVLDTSIRQAEAQGRYRRLGFQEVPLCYDLPH